MKPCAVGRLCLALAFSAHSILLPCDLLQEEAAIFYVLEEPNLELDYEKWAAWYDGIKVHRDELLAAMDAEGIRPLPPAVKGTGWSEDTAPARPAEMSECLTLHGQRGGGL